MGDEVTHALSKAQRVALGWVADNEQNLSDWNQVIWQFAEPAWREYRSAAWYVERLRAEGFSVEEGSGGMPTAFMATYGNGAPVLGAYAEYDVVPGNCQDATPYPKPRDGLSRFAAGHTDPHSALGIGALAGLLGAKHAMDELDLPGTLRFFGEPAEKVLGSKPVHAAKGYYDGVDAFISFHPAYMLPYFNTTRWDTHSGATYTRIYEFRCEEPETWLSSAASPIPAAHGMPRAPGALDAACLMYTAVKYTKDNIIPTAVPWFMSEFMMAGGQATADNLPHHIALLQYCWRTPGPEYSDRLLQVLDNNADHAAALAHCAVRKHWASRLRPGLANHAMAALTYRNLAAVGPPVFGDEAKEFARAIQRNLDVEPMAEPFADACSELITPEAAEAKMRESLPPGIRNFTSDDYVEYTWHAPTARLYVGRPMLNTPQPGYQYPAWVMNALGGHRACIDPMIMSAGRTIAATLVDLLTNRAALERAQSEFKERTGGGIGGTRWRAPLLPPDFAPPINFPWPEYISTVRGDEWWIPTTDDDR